MTSTREEHKQLCSLQNKAESLLNVFKKNQLYFQLESAALQTLDYMLCEIKRASSFVNEADNYNSPDIQTYMRLFDTSVAEYFRESETTLCRYTRVEIENAMSNTGDFPSAPPF